MSIQTTFNFDNAANFNLSNTQIQSGKAKLSIVDNPGQVFSQAFTSDSGFTYDNTKAEFVGGVVRQKDQRPTSSILGATFDTSKNFNWADFSPLTPSAERGTPTISGGKLICTGGGNTGVSYTNAAIGALGDTGTVRIKVTPNYSGTPSVNYPIFELRPTSGNNSRMVLFHGATGFIRFTAYNSAGTIIHSAVNIGASAWVPVAGTEYEFEFTWDTGVTTSKLYIDGVLKGATSVFTYSRGTSATILDIGSGGTYTAADASFNDLLLYSIVNHSSNYTPGYVVPGNIYAASTVVLPAFSYTGLGTIQALESSSVTETGAPRYIVADKYFNGTAWVNSNGSYAQANTSAEVLANLSSLTVQGAGSFVMKVVFTDSASQSSVDLLSVTVTGQKYSPTGYLEPVQNLEVQALLAYAQTATLPGSTTAKVILKIDGVLKYHNGTAWVNSDGSSAQANFAADLDAAFEDLVLGQNSTVFLRWVLATPSNTDTPELDEAVITYDFGGVESEPEKCLVYGYVRDIAGLPVSGATVRFDLIKANTREYKEAESNVILKNFVETTTDSNGYFEQELIRSSEYEGTGTYAISVTKDTLEASRKGSNLLRFEVPDADTKDITDLLEAS